MPDSDPGNLPLLPAIESVKHQGHYGIQQNEFPPAVESADAIFRRVWRSWIPYVYPTMKGDPWEPLKDGIGKFDKEMCDAWNGELDTILTFTGLFSAALTAFCVESLQRLSQSPEDTTNVFLLAISQQLANATSSKVASFDMVDDFIPSTHDIQINVLYFLSLTLALSVSTVCILGKQWIREYQKDVAVSSREAIRVRQARFDSLEAWKVPQIMAALPVIVLTALLLFFAGLLVQLWNRAAVVTIAVALTILFIIMTTVVPAYSSGKHCRAAFTPFRSPQAWIFFVVYRRFQQWCHGLLRMPGKAPATLSRWSAFDLQFLKTETEDWFEHEVSSIHCALRWVYDVLRSNSVMEKSLYWCLQSQFHPQDLIPSLPHLWNHVLCDSEEAKVSDNIYRVYRDYSYRTKGNQNIDSPAGRHQVESVIRSAHYTLDNIAIHNARAWDQVINSFRDLYFLDIFDKPSITEALHHRHVVQDQISLLLERVFIIDWPLGAGSSWAWIVTLVLRARRDFSSPLSCQIMWNIMHKSIPGMIKRRKSMSLLYRIAQAIHYPEDMPWKHAIELFARLDRTMVQMCQSPEQVEGYNEASVKKWSILRERFIRDTRSPRFKVPKHFQLPDRYFDDLPNHGPLPSLASLPMG